MKKNKSSILNMTWDIKIKIVGKTLDNLFLQALEGLAQSVYRNYKANQTDQITLSIKVSSIDINSLLVDFLSEVLYKSEINKGEVIKSEMLEVKRPALGVKSRYIRAIMGARAKRKISTNEPITWRDLC